jgi:hypothetical protein
LNGKNSRVKLLACPLVAMSGIGVGAANDALLQPACDPSQWKAAGVSQKHNYLSISISSVEQQEFGVVDGRELFALINLLHLACFFLLLALVLLLHPT